MSKRRLERWGLGVGCTTTERRILAACREAERQGFRIVSEHHGLALRDGVYAPAGRLECLPLEALLRGKHSCGGFEADIVKEVSVSSGWVLGFLAGFAL